MSEYPEHDKLVGLGGDNQVIGDFLEWLAGGYEGSPSLAICEFREEKGPMLIKPDGSSATFFDADAEVNPDYQAGGYHPTTMSTQDLLALYFAIDQDRLEAEKREMLNEQRKLNEQASPA